MRDAHVPVVYHNTEVVGGCTVWPGDDEVIQLTVVKGDWPLDHIVPRRYTILWSAEADDRLAVGGHGGQRFARFRAPGTVVTGLQPGRTGFFSHGFDFFRRTVAVVGSAFWQHALDHLAVAVHAPHLIKGAFVGIQPQPRHAVQNGLNGFRCGAFQVGV